LPLRQLASDNQVEPLEESLKPVAEQLAFNSGLLSESFAGLDDARASSEPCPGGNSVKWLCGHVVTGRHHILTLLGGAPPSAPWGNMFEDSTRDVDPASLPTIAHIQQRLEQSSRLLLRSLATADRRLLQTAPSSPFPTVENTTLAAVAFLANHEAYHVGQVSYARRLLGLPGLVTLMLSKQG
jgi:uncharacterized damage-inducible protein DinB